jgi:uncharacterized protein (TIGR03067 family)
MKQAWCVLIAAGVVFALGAGTDAVKKEQKKLQGVWKVVEMSGGDKRDAEKDKSIRVKFKGNKLTIKMGDKFLGTATYTVDPTKSPATMDVTIEKDGKQETILAIYEVKGNTMRFCHHDGEAAGTSRPKTFEATPTTVLTVLKRKK